MNVVLPPDLERRIAEQVEAGLYASASEVVRASSRLLFEAEEAPESRMGRLRADIESGLAQLDRAEGISGDLVLADITERLERRRVT
jgi:putative addiction module CopG family antidote